MTEEIPTVDEIMKAVTAFGMASAHTLDYTRHQEMPEYKALRDLVTTLRDGYDGADAAVDSWTPRGVTT